MTSTKNRLTDIPINGQKLYGMYENVSHEYDSFSISINSDQSGQLTIHQSNDAGGTDHHDDTYNISSFPYFKYFARKADYVRIVWHNDSGTDNTEFFLQLKYHKETLRDINDPIAHDADSVLVYGTDGNNNYPLLTDASGTLQTDSSATITVNNLYDSVEAGSTINAGADSSSVDIQGYKDGWIIYEDTETSVSDPLSFWVSSDDVIYYPTDTLLYPTDHYSESKRVVTHYMVFSGIKYFRLRNESASAVNNVNLQVMGNNI